jgi:undecaprenyl-diphosphatase
LIQGATEFLPVSSSAHLAFFGALAGIREKDALPFFLVLHMGTLAALLAYFAKDLIKIGKGCLKKDRSSYRLILMIILTTIPTGIIGLALKGSVEKVMVSPFWAASFLLVTAIILFTTKFFGKDHLELDSLTVTQAIFIGIAQGVAVLPGISRSGSTTVAALFCGLKRDDAFRYSFLASMPAIGGAFLLDFKDISTVGASFGAGIMVSSFLLSMFIGFLSLFFLRKVVIRGVLHYFSFYCIFASAGGFLIASFCR